MVSEASRKSGGIAQMIESIVINTLRKTRICSFTVSNSNLLFWSHYAQSHTGMCISFRTDGKYFGAAFKIQYSNSLPELIYPTPGDHTCFRPFLVKSEEWMYENEYRTLFREGVPYPSNSNGSVILEGNEISDVYLGCKVSDQDIFYIKYIISLSDFKPNLWKAKMSDDSFSLEFERIQ